MLDYLKTWKTVEVDYGKPFAEILELYQKKEIELKIEQQIIPKVLELRKEIDFKKKVELVSIPYSCSGLAFANIFQPKKIIEFLKAKYQLFYLDMDTALMLGNEQFNLDPALKSPLVYNLGIQPIEYEDTFLHFHKMEYTNNSSELEKRLSINQFFLSNSECHRLMEWYFKTFFIFSKTAL